MITHDVILMLVEKMKALDEQRERNLAMYNDARAHIERLHEELRTARDGFYEWDDYVAGLEKALRGKGVRNHASRPLPLFHRGI